LCFTDGGRNHDNGDLLTSAVSIRDLKANSGGEKSDSVKSTAIPDSDRAGRKHRRAQVAVRLAGGWTDAD
jgi:hypothetical protein